MGRTNPQRPSRHVHACPARAHRRAWLAVRLSQSVPTDRPRLPLASVKCSRPASRAGSPCSSQPASASLLASFLEDLLLLATRDVLPALPGTTTIVRIVQYSSSVRCTEYGIVGSSTTCTCTIMYCSSGIFYRMCRRNLPISPRILTTQARTATQTVSACANGACLEPRRAQRAHSMQRDATHPSTL